MKDGKIVYEFIDTVPNASKEVLYGRIAGWFAETFNDSKEVIMADDKATGLIIGKGIFTIRSGGILSTANWLCSFTVTVNYKDNKIRSVFSAFSYGEGKWTIEPYYERYSQGKSKKALEPMIRTLDDNVRSLHYKLATKCNTATPDF